MIRIKIVRSSLPLPSFSSCYYTTTFITRDRTKHFSAIQFPCLPRDLFIFFTPHTYFRTYFPSNDVTRLVSFRPGVSSWIRANGPSAVENTGGRRAGSFLAIVDSDKRTGNDNVAHARPSRSAGR